MKNVRVFYKKTDRMKFISHLDMNRFMTRAVRRTDIPVWYTEGFNCHAYITFALPLSLGFESEYEVMDFKVTDDTYPLDKIERELTAVMPEYIEIIKADEPVMKSGKIAYAAFSVFFDEISEKLTEDIKAFLSSPQILCTKKNKKGIETQIDISPRIKSWEINSQELKLILAAGNDNLNPTLLLSALESYIGGALPSYSITRTALFDEELNIFR